ncbi:MFS transporter [Sulfitobacter alexandrii]|uniref:MFS transporter n=1 Tax=Sulfitobacter alexandrii TaxID=1917485 RepID=UPI0009F993EF|nr:MFS transporter [Sulfitobacter alexandrii]
MTTQAQTAPKPDYVSWREFLSAGYTAPLVLVCLGVWMHAADSLVVATMLPAIVAEIGGAAYVSWTVSIYEIGSIVAGAASALLTLRHGLRLPMAGAALCFAAGCALSALSGSMGLVLVGRGLQGLGGGGLVALSFIAINALFPRRLAARTLAVVSAFWGMSAFLGPLLGGLFVEFATWRWGFAFFAAQALGLGLWIALRTEPGKTALDESPPGPFPLFRLAVLCGAVVLISAGGVRVEMLRSTLLILAGGACLWWFLWRDARAGAARLLPAAPLDPRRATGATLLMLLCMSMATIGLLAYGPLLMTLIHGMSALTAGYIVAASSIGWTLAAVAVSGSPERRDRLWIGLGMGITTVSVAGLAHAVPHGPIWLIALFAGLDGAGFGLAWTFILRRVTALVPPAEAARVSGAIPTVQRMGYALGAAYVGIVVNAGGFLEMEGPSDAAHVATLLFLWSLPLALIGLAAMAGLLRRHPHDDRLQMSSPAAPS